MTWTRARVALQGCLALAALVMLYEGMFQIGWLRHLACPGFGGGCESVALASFTRPAGFSAGLLRAAYFGVMLALAQVARKEAALATVVMAAVAVGLYVMTLADMRHFGAWCFWCVFALLLSAAALALAVISARQPFADAAPAR